MPKFSIIIPVCNVAPYLRESLDSVLSQTFTDWEAICVDDGSTDGSGSILDEYAGRESRVRVVHQQNKGVSVARNVALGLAKGEWLTFLDGDDVVAQDAYARYADIVSRNEADAYFMQLPMRFVGHPTRMCRGDGRIKFLTSRGGDMLHLECRLPGFPFVRVLRRTLFGGMRFPIGVPMLEDYLTLFDNLAVSARFAEVNLVAYCYRERVGSASRVYPVGRIRSIFEIYEHVYHDIQDRLGVSSANANWYFRQNRSANQFYFYEAVRSESRENLVAVADILMRLCQATGGGLVGRFAFVRCWILVKTRRPLFFGLIGAYEYVYRGVAARVRHWLEER